jgi:flagellar biosynthesis/type III secretory pathway ATPase
VVPTGSYLTIKVGDSLLGRVLNGLGEPMDAEFKGPLDFQDEYAVYQTAPDPLHRNRVNKPISIGVRAIDSLLTCGEGQRIGLFAAAGAERALYSA